MENDTTISKEGLLEPVFPGSVTFESSILAPLHNSYLYEESREFFTYISAQLINNTALQKRYSAFRTEKRQNGYSEEELKESFGFLLLDDKSRANRLADTGLIVGQGTCTTLGDCSKGVYISKYSDCLDLKRWYDGKTGYIVLLTLTKGRVKEVTENYTQNFTPPTAGFDCHVSEQLREVCATTSSFLAFERTQYYMYELPVGGEKVEQCPRHVCPVAIVAFSYGKTAISLELKEKSQEKSSFLYQPWRGQLKIASVLYNIGLKSIHGAMFPANLSKTIEVNQAVGVSELRKILPQAVFETSPLGEVSLDGKWFSMYDVNSFDARNEIAFLTQELKEKDMALVICLKDGGFLVILHSSNFLSYEGAGTDKAFALQGMFIYPDSRTVPRETKSGYHKTSVSSEVLQVLPALNYAELEMEKCPPKQHEEPLGIMEKHLQNFAALICPGLTSSPSREASMFPDQYDVPDGFLLIAPKWTDQTGDHLRTYLASPHSFQIPVARALELLAAGKQQRSDDQDDDVYCYISSPEAPQTPADMVVERDVPNEADHITCRNVSDDVKKSAEQQAETEKTVAAQLSHCALIEEVGTPGVTMVATPDNVPVERTDPSPTSGDLPTEHYALNVHAVNTAQDCEKTPECVSVNDQSSGGEFSGPFLKETIEATSVALSSTEIGDDASTVASNSEMELDQPKKVDCLSDDIHKVEGQIPVADKVLQEGDLPTSISPPTESVNRTEPLIKGCKEVQPEASNTVPAATKSMPKRCGKRRRRKALKRNANTVCQITTPLQNTTLSLSSSTEATPEQGSNSDMMHSSPSSLKKDWRSLPRRKRHWTADSNVKRTLRSDLKNTEMLCDKNSESEKNTTNTELAENIMPSTPKRKMEGINMRERYGLKPIITDCGSVFVPHGSEAAPRDIKSNENKQAQESSFVASNSPSTTTPTHDKPQPSELESRGQHIPFTHIQNISVNPAKTLSSGDITDKDPVSPKNSEQPSVLKSTEKNKSVAKDHVYRAISISKLKTVLKRASTKSPGTLGHGKSISDNLEPELKRGKASNDVELSDIGKPTPHADDKKGNYKVQHNPESARSQDPVENTPSKQPLRTTCSQKKQISGILKENGCNNFDNFSSNEIVKQADHHLISGPVKNRIEGKHISSDGQSNKEKVAVGVPAPSDGLNLLADLALSVNSDEMLPNLGEKHLGAKTSSSPQTVIHLLRDLTPRLKLPPESPFPEGLVLNGDLILEISKEHSYSQPTSLLSGSTGIFPQVQPLVGCIKSHLSMKPDHLLKIPDLTSCPDYHNKGSKNGWRFLTSLSASAPDAIKAKGGCSVFFCCRSIIEKEESIQVTRHWKENYDFKFDSKFTNDKLDKCVARALHGKWDFSIEDSYEQVHLIFHMWIGLFYSKPTSRFFHFDQFCPTVERQNPAKVLQSAIQSSTLPPDVDVTSKGGKPTSLGPVLDAIDLSVKASGAVDHCTTGDDPTPSSDMGSKLEHMRENKEPAIRPSLNYSPSVLAGGILMDYRSIVEALDENSASDYNDYSDLEDDTTDVTERSYTKLLASNSAYSQLCGHASTLRIDEQKLLNVEKKEFASKDLPTSKTVDIKSIGTMGTETKDVVVFHQVVGPVRPVIFSKVHDSLHGRKIVLKSLSFKDKHKDEAPVSVRVQSSASKDEQCEAAVNEEKHESISVCVETGNQKECVPKTKTGSSSGIFVPMNDENKAQVKVVLLTRDETPMVIPDVNSSTKEKCVSGERNNKVLCNDIGDTPMDVLDINNKTKQEVMSVTDDTLRDVRKDDKLVEMHVDDEASEKVGPVQDDRDDVPMDTPDVTHRTKEEVKPVSHVWSDAPREMLDDDETKYKETLVPVRDDTSLNAPDMMKSQKVVTPVVDSTSSQDVENDTHVGVHVNDGTGKVLMLPDIGGVTSVYVGENTPHGVPDEHDDASDEVQCAMTIRDTSVNVLAESKDKFGVIDSLPVDEQDVNNTNTEAQPELDIRADMSADIQDVNNLNKEAKSGLDVRDDTPANMQDVDNGIKDETKCQPDVRDCSSVDRQHDVCMTEMCAMDERVSEKDESNTDEITNESERKVAAELICDANIELHSEKQNTIENQDWTDCVDMDFSDSDSEDENQERAHQVNVSGGQSLSKALEDIVKLPQGEIKTDADVASKYKEHTRECAQPRLSDYSSVGHVSSTSHELIMLKEAHSLPAVGSTCIQTQNDSESTMLHDTIVVQHETPEVRQYKPEKVCGDVFPLTEVINPEAYEIKDSSTQGTTEVANDLVVLSVNVSSSKDPRMLEENSNQKPLVPTLCETSICKNVKIHDHFDSMDASPSALQIDTEAEINSRCCTPTLDEPAYSRGTDEASNAQELNYQDISETEDYHVKESPNNTWLVLDSSEESHSGLEKSPAHREQILPQDPCWSHDQCDATVGETEESKLLITDEHVPKEYSVYFDYDELPTHRNTKEIQPHQDQLGSFSEKYQEQCYEEFPSSWTHNVSFKTEEQKDLRKWYAPDEDTCYTNSISVHREVAYRPRDITESNSGSTSGWVQRIHYSEYSPNVDESNERVLSFRHQAHLTKSKDEYDGHESEPVHYRKKKCKRRFCQNEGDEEDFNVTVDYSIKKTFSCSSGQSSISRTRTSSPCQHKEESKEPFDWHRYFRREGTFESNEGNDGPFHDPPPSIVTMFDTKGNRVIFESPSTQKRLSGIYVTGQSMEEQGSKADIQSLMEIEYLTFSEKMTHLLKNCKTTSRVKAQPRLNISPVETPMTIQFSRLDEQNSFSGLDQNWPTLSKFKINVDMSERKALKKTPNYSKPLHLQRLFCERGTEATCSKLSDITKECSKSYHTMMNDICIGKTISHQNDKLKRKWDIEHATTSKQSGFCGRIKKDMFDHLHDDLNSIVRQACKAKYKFFILVTSADPFFEETKELLEAEGHAAVEPYQFDFDANGQIPLLIILRNEDIAEHIFEVPHLLELKKSSRVLFAGIDQPDDVVNLTHQEVFAKGGFLVFDETALDTLNLENMKKVVGIMEELDKKGKWKWYLHYRDSRKLRENSRCSPEAQRKKQFIDCCQEAGMVEILPYHECDVISRDRPDYIRCLVCLQIQNISARFPVFITDTTDESFEKNGILTMNIYTFSRILSNDTCSVS